MDKASSFAPATVANVGSGFDILGFALNGLGDRILAEKTGQAGLVEVAAISGTVTSLPKDPKKNTAAVAVASLLRACGEKLGVRLSIEKGIPLGSGMGGSAASAVGAVVAANQLLGKPFTKLELLSHALAGEAVASGAEHADNVAPCLLGGLTLVESLKPMRVRALPLPPGVLCVLVHPHFVLSTREARRVLKPDLPLLLHIEQSRRLAAMVAGCFAADREAVVRGLEDRVIEPQRAGLIPGFANVKEAAVKAGALGCTISGAGPSVFAWVSDAETGERVRAEMVRAFRAFGNLDSDSWISPISQEGARVQ